MRKECELTIDGVNVKNSRPLGSITVSAIFRPVQAVARSELDVQQALPGIQVTAADHHRNSVITTVDGSAEPTVPRSIVGGVSDVSRNMLRDSGRYIIGAIAGSRVRRNIVYNTVQQEILKKNSPYHYQPGDYESLNS